MSSSPMQDNIKKDALGPKKLGEGNEFYVDLLTAHEQLDSQYSLNKNSQYVLLQRRAWRETKPKSGFDWCELVEIDNPDEQAQIPQRVIEFFSVDDHPFIFLRMEPDEAREVEHFGNVIIGGAEWSPLRYKTPLVGQMCLIDLVEAKKLSRFEKKCSLALDLDGSIGKRISVESANCYLRSELRGGLSAVSKTGVLRGWATITTDRDSAVPLTAVIDGEHEAHFYAREAYGSNKALRQFSFHLPGRFLDGDIHRISIYHAGTDKALVGASSIYIVSNQRTMLVISNVNILDDQLTLTVTNMGDCSLAEQSDYFDRQRIFEVKRMLFSPPWLASIPLRFLAAKLKGIKAAPLAPKNVTIDQCLFLREQIEKSISWRLSRPLRWLNVLLPRAMRWGWAGSALRSDLRFRMLKGESAVAEFDARRAPITGHDFSTGTGLFSHIVKPSNATSVIEVHNAENELLAKISLGRLLSLRKMSK